LSMQSCIYTVYTELRDCVSCKLTAASQRELCVSDIMKIESLYKICFYQKSENLIFLKIIFTHLVCEINERNHQFQCSALDIIQVTADLAEFTLITLFK
ncbi:hypothetical protein BDFG_09260, partial [Blastomyces dermatitidis ATCC 26199]